MPRVLCQWLKQGLELPIDHFRLLGISPSAETETVLRTCQMRIDRPPQNGFTSEALLQRSELLQLSADLLSDQSLRNDYESALLGGASGLEFSSNREAAGLILLWEADASIEAFGLAKRALQPPQAPALGSGREADLTLVAALACKDAADQEQQERKYESAASLLRDGIQLLQRMGKLPEEREDLQKMLEALLPYRILDLLSRDIGDRESHEEGVKLLDSFVRERGGLEGRKSRLISEGLKQHEFELFFQQIRKFLTVQEQLDLFILWRKRGSADSGFLFAISLVAEGFSHRKPERLEEARKYLKNLDFPGLDVRPLLGCICLLLADIQQAEKFFLQNEDYELGKWLKNYEGEYLGAFCDYCRNWLAQDVLPGYRDIDSKAIDLEAWFSDRDVQKYIESQERSGAIGFAKNGLSFLNSLSGEKPDSAVLSDQLTDSSTSISNLNEEELEFELEESDDSEKITNKITQNLNKIKDNYKSSMYYILNNFKDLKINIFPKNYFYQAILVLILIIIGSSLGLFTVNRKNSEPKVLDSGSLVEEKSSGNSLENTILNLENSENSKKELLIKAIPLKISNPNDEQIRNLIENWLALKAYILGGNKTSELEIVARDRLVKAVDKERSEDITKNQIQKIETSILSMSFIDRTQKRIEVKVVLSYKNQKIIDNQSSALEYIPRLNVTYILGRDKELWQLVAYKSGS